MTIAAPKPWQPTGNLLGIHDGERLLVGLLFAQYFFTGTASAFTQTASFALFLSAFEPGQLPLTYIMMGAIISLLTMAYLQAGRFLSFANQLKLNLVGQIVITTGFALGLVLVDGDWLTFGLPILFQIAVVFGNMAFWSLAGRMLNVQQGKRLFGVVGTGEWLAIVAVGFLMPVLVPLVGLPNLLWLAVLGMGAALLVMTINMRLHRHLLGETAAAAAPLPDRTKAQATPPASLLKVLRSPYVGLLFGLSMVWWVGFFFVDNVFYYQAALQFPNGEELAGFLGLYLGLVGILSLLSNLFLAGPVVGRLGLRWSLLALPLGLAVGTAIMALAGLLDGPLLVVFGAAVATKMWSIAIGFSVDQSARSILVQPFSAELRTRVQTLIDGVAQPVSTGVAGALLLLLGALFPQTAMPLVYGLLVVVAAHIVIAVLVNRGYGRALLSALSARRLTGAQLVVTDTSRAILVEGLRNREPGAVVYAMRMLSQAAPDALAEHLPRLLENPEPDIRRYALECIAATAPQGALTIVHNAMASEAAPDVLAAGLRALARLGDSSLALRHLESADGVLRKHAILAALDSGESDARAAALSALAGLCVAPGAADRSLAADILAEGQAEPGQIQALLADAAPEVRRSALRAAGRIGSAEFWPTVIAALEEPRTLNVALSALVAGGAGALPAISAAMQSGVSTPNQMVGLARASGRIRAPAAVPSLLALVEDPDTAIRGSALRALRQCGYGAAAGEIPRLHAAIRREAEYAAWLSAVAADIGADDAVTLLQAALGEQMRHCRIRVLDLLASCGNAVAIERAVDNLATANPRQRSYALEIIDIETPVALKPLVLPLLEDLAPEQRLQRLHPYFPQVRIDQLARLAELSTNVGGRLDPWTRATALYALSRLDPEAFSRLPAGGNGSGDAVRASEDPLDGDNDVRRGDQRMLSTIEKVIMLRTAGIFSETADEVLAAVSQIATVSEVAPGEVILAKGDHGDSMFLVASGRVRVHDGARALAELGPGEVFGEMALLDPEARSASVTAIDDTCLLTLDQQAFFELVDDRPEVARGLLRVLSRRLRKAI